MEILLDNHEIEQLLGDLCTRLGFCLPPKGYETIIGNPPAELHAFVDAVFIAEGLNPETADRHLWRKVRDMVADAHHAAAAKRESH